ncbi:amidohydrolase [Pseudochrobactrum sp. sp1633]|uniref:amidohydrolase n=1 Tax=Pseudochrobactrum sp. sp1633 TaxID=3036706 RepID=UPI0025A56D4F|nr:amidohydrolase [Pseudochrobactrum sp. sp1633]MDM8346636.1 amidohydrolase [Pseudochrobactrum sp. sp1633]HWD13988.1 amidohydrolase [Pseudochrobactrum sp.]
MRHLLQTTSLVFAGLLPLINAAAAADASPDLILYNGNIITMDEEKPVAQALAISGQKIIAVGDDALADRLKTNETRIIDLKGKTVIPGLVDTHIHAIRGGQTYTFETYWYDKTKLSDALTALQEAAAGKQKDEWVAVVGSWLPEQFEEKRAPNVAELSAAVPDHPVYVQYLYDYALVNDKGIEVLRLNEAAPALPQGITVERDAHGKATGKLLGHIGSYNALFSAIAPADNEQRLRSLQIFFSDLNRAGMTGFIDPSAGPSSAYEALFALQRAGKLTIRAGYRIPAMKPGAEAEWFENIMAFRQPYYDTGMVSFVGIGESIVAAMNDGVQMGPGFQSSQKAKDELRKVATFAAEGKIPLEIHAYTDDAASDILDVFEAVNTTHPLKDLRWSLAHLNTGSENTLERMKKLGLSYTVQMGPYFEGPAILKANGAEVAAKSPPTRAAIDKDILVAGGTDSTRIGVFGVWQAIEYHVTGRSLGGAIQKPRDQLLSREEALELYTKNAAWIGFAEKTRGTLEAGKLADLAVLDKPYLTMPADEIDSVRSVLTIVNGHVVYDNLRETPATAQ